MIRFHRVLNYIFGAFAIHNAFPKNEVRCLCNAIVHLPVFPKPCNWQLYTLLLPFLGVAFPVPTCGLLL